MTAAAGAGHVVAARAIEQALRRRLPDVEIELLEVLEWSNPFFRRLYAQGYLSLVNHAPTFMGILYEAFDRPNQRFRDAIRTTFQNMNLHVVARHLRQRRPALIIHTHFLPAEMVAEMRRRRRLSCPHVTITTDFETHRMWAQHPTERYYTATADGKAYLCTWNVPPDDVLVTGIPLRAEFDPPPDRAAARQIHGLEMTRPAVLMLCGGFGVGPTERFFDELIALPPTVQLIVITGRNERLRQRLATAADRRGRDVRVVGFSDQMHTWIAAADLVVSKPGGLTVSESLMCGVPLVVVNPIPGQEARNSDYLLEHGAAIKVNNPRLLGHRVRELLDDPERLAGLRSAARILARPGAARRIVSDALNLIGAPPESGDQPAFIQNPAIARIGAPL
ncbi:MAG: Processive diacylglycerol beta-glucosyltransferase [Phycisphaerae bacterium]|nr:Processive diacylglycerol beta-glucosyltransferase [Phycisphaerae bacterium]